MSKKVVLVGHCGPDSSYLRMIVSKAASGIKVLSADDSGELAHLLADGVDLLLFNRELGYGFNDQEGVSLIREMRRRHPGIKMMLVSNYPDAQEAAEAAGARPGFGKRELGSSRVVELLRLALDVNELVQDAPRRT